uniref:Mitochondrial inner membrane protease subunit, putative n=1 Tax=Arundo donax TaxID=35708 RepID=A0A0A9D2V7_ARUDO
MYHMHIQGTQPQFRMVRSISELSPQKEHFQEFQISHKEVKLHILCTTVYNCSK